MLTQRGVPSLSRVRKSYVRTGSCRAAIASTWQCGWQLRLPCSVRPSRTSQHGRPSTADAVSPRIASAASFQNSNVPSASKAMTPSATCRNTPSASGSAGAVSPGRRPAPPLCPLRWAPATRGSMAPTFDLPGRDSCRGAAGRPLTPRTLRRPGLLSTGRLRVLDSAGVVSAPPAHRLQDGGYGAAKRGQRIFHLGGDMGVHLAMHQPVVLQLPQLRRQHLRRRASDQPPELAEPLGPVLEVVQDSRLPFTPDHAEGRFNPAVVVIHARSSGHGVLGSLEINTMSENSAY